MGAVAGGPGGPAGLRWLDILGTTPASAATTPGSQNSVSGYGSAITAVGNQSGLGGPLGGDRFDSRRKWLLDHIGQWAGGERG